MRLALYFAACASSREGGGRTGSRATIGNRTSPSVANLARSAAAQAGRRHGRLLQRREQRGEFAGIETTIAAHAAAHVDAERLHRGDRLGHVARVQSTREIQRHVNGVADAAADRPVVRAAGAAEFLHGEQRVA